MNMRMLRFYTRSRRLTTSQHPHRIVEPDLDTQCEQELEPWDRFGARNSSD